MERQSVTLSEVSGGEGRRHGASPMSAAARVRETGEAFPSSFSMLQEAVREACAGLAEWEARIVAGVGAVLAFSAANPSRAKALTVDARRGTNDREHEVISYFAERIGEGAPEKRFPISTDVAIVESIATVVRGHLLDGTADRLPDAAPDLVNLVLMPYLGLAETQRWI